MYKHFKTSSIASLKGLDIERNKSVSEKHGIKKLKAGPKYTPSGKREMRDQIKCFVARDDLTDQTYDKLFKVLASEPGAGFPKSELTDFLRYFAKHCKLNKDLLEEAEVEKMSKAVNLKDAKNSKSQLTEFMN